MLKPSSVIQGTPQKRNNGSYYFDKILGQPDKRNIKNASIYGELTPFNTLRKISQPWIETMIENTLESVGVLKPAKNMLI